jgi:rhamnogalacturonan endolyase
MTSTIHSHPFHGVKIYAAFSIAPILVLLLLLAVDLPCWAEFGITSSVGLYTVDNGGNLQFQINQANGDMWTCTYKGIQICDVNKHSQIASGLGSATVSATTNGNLLMITCVSSDAGVVPTPLKHYYIAQRNDDHLYMATYVSSEPSIGELRYILRAQYNVLPNGPAGSDNNGNTGAIEGSDVYGHADGTTTSKFYDAEQACHLSVKGATGSGIGVYMMYGNRESSSSGPFLRDIENQGDGVNSDQEIYNYMNSGHNQLEPFRTNVLYGPYGLAFTNDTDIPTVPNMGFVSVLGLQGYVNHAGRGSLKLNAINGIDARYPYVVGYANDKAQYWIGVTINGYGQSDNMKAGVYNMTIYKGELEVYYETNIVVTAGATNTLYTRTITDDPSQDWNFIFRIGNWDGTPLEFLNGSNIPHMHPSDVRENNWGPVTFNVTSQFPNPANFPALQFRAANSPTTITFNLTAAQAAVNHTLMIGITHNYAGGRPNPVINGYSLGYPSAPTEPNDRSYTRGTYRGYNYLFPYTVPAAHLVAGANTLTINVVSGSGDLGPWLSPGWAYDCIQFDN